MVIDLSYFEKVSAAKWVNHFRGLIKKKKFTSAENMATGMTTGFSIPGTSGYKGHAQNLRAIIASGSFKNRSGLRAKLGDEGIVNMTRKAVKEQKHAYEPSLKERLHLFKEQKSMANLHSSQKTPIRFDKHPLADPRIVRKKEVPIIHTGTDSRISGFLSGKYKGTTLQGRGRGIWVHPNASKRSASETLKSPMSTLHKRNAALVFGGRPATLTASTAPKNLLGMNTGYEAGLIGKNINKLNNVKITVKPEPKKEMFELVKDLQRRGGVKGQTLSQSASSMVKKKYR